MQESNVQAVDVVPEPTAYSPRRQCPAAQLCMSETLQTLEGVPCGGRRQCPAAVPGGTTVPGMSTQSLCNFRVLQRPALLRHLPPARQHVALGHCALRPASLRRLRETIQTLEVQEDAGEEAKVPAVEAVEVAHSPHVRSAETMEVQHQEQSAIGRDTEAALAADEAHGPRQPASTHLSTLLPCHAASSLEQTEVASGFFMIN